MSSPKTRPLLIFCLLLIPFLVTTRLWAASPIVITNDHESNQLGFHLDFLEDSTGKLTITDVTTNPEIAAKFTPSTQKTLGFGFTDSAYWLRFTIANQLNEASHHYLEVTYPLLDHIDLYTHTGNNRFKVTRAGDQLPFSARDLQYRNNVFEIKLGAGMEKTYYIRCQTTSSMNIPLLLLSQRGLSKRVNTEQTMLGIYYGILLVMLIYNLFIFISIRDITYLYYVLFISAFLFFQLSLTGVAFQFFWQESLWWANINLPFFMFVSYFFAIQFSRKILDTPHNTPRLDKILLINMALSVIGAVTTFLVSYAISIRFATLLSVSMLVLFVCGLICAIKGYRPARYYFIAWSVFITGIIIYALKTFGILPHTLFTNWCIQIGSAWEVILLSLSLADRLHLMEAENKQIHIDYAEQLRNTNLELERSNTKLETFNRELEQLVSDRTIDLSHLNENLRKEASERRDAENRAEKASQAKSEFLANMSHEIRTPMNAILGMTHLAFKLDHSPKMKKYLEIISNSAQSLMGIINDILDFSKIEAGKLVIEEYEYKFAETLEFLANLFSPKLGEKNLNLIFNIDDNVPPVLLGDPLRLQQILINLIANAFKFTTKGQIVLTVRCPQQTTETATLSFAVTDSGIGIDKDAQKKLFRAFTQEDGSTTRNFGGTGLGLTISKRLVSLMNGEITVSSEPGQGSTFSFTITCKQNRQQPGHPLILPESLQNLKVLVADANQESVASLKQTLHLFGCIAETSLPGEETLQKLHQAQSNAEPFHLLLLDTIIEPQKALDLAKTIHENYRLRILPILFITAVGRDEDTEQTTDNDKIIKPITPQALLKTILITFGHAKCDSIDENDKTETLDLERDVRILLVEDNKNNQLIASTMLKSPAITIDISENGLEAVEAVRHNNYDLVLMDVQLPKMDGLEATGIIRKELGKTELPIIALTAGAMSDDRQKCINAGMNDYLSKPINSKHLWEMLRKHLGDTTLPTKNDSPPSIPAAVPAFLPGLTITKALSRMDNDWELYISTITEFPVSYGTSPAQIEQALTENDYDTAQRLTHTIKGLSATFGMENVHGTACTIEKLIKTKTSQSDIIVEITTLQDNLHEIEAVINKLVQLTADELLPEN